MGGPQRRDTVGRFDTKLREQDLLKVFDYETTLEEPYLTVREIQIALERHFDIEVSDQTVRNHLNTMRETGDVSKRDFGSAVAYRAEVAPELADDVELNTYTRRGHDDLWDELDE